MYIHAVLIIIAFATILLWLLAASRPVDAKDDQPTLPAILLASWTIAGAVFGFAFYVLKIPGVFDITIERLLFSLILLLLVTGLFTGKVRFQTNITIEIVMGIFVLLCLLSMLRTGFTPLTPEFVSPWFVFITGYLFPFLVFVFAKNYIFSARDVTLIFHALFYFGLYLSIISFFEFYDLSQFVFPGYIRDPLVSPLHLERARGPFLNAAFNGVGILIGFISGLHLLEKKTGLAKAFYQGSLLLFFPAVFFTLTRSVYLGLLVALFIFLGWYKTSFSKWKLIALPLAVVMILGIAQSPRLLSADRRAGGVAQVEEVSIRLALLKISYTLYSEHPLTGVGLAQFIPATYYAKVYKGKMPPIVEEAVGTFQHNHLLGIATELGLPGFLAYLTLLILILRRLKQLAGKMAPTGIMGNNLRITILAIWCVYLTNNLFVEPSNNIFINSVPFLFAGIADGLYTRHQELVLPSQSRVRISQSPMRTINNHV